MTKYLPAVGLEHIGERVHLPHNNALTGRVSLLVCCRSGFHFFATAEEGAARRIRTNATFSLKAHKNVMATSRVLWI